jgi:hypothetical protein
MGEVSASFSMEGCSDLQVGVIPIDLCQSADFGRSYLSVVDAETGAVVIAKNNIPIISMSSDIPK